MKLHFLLMTLAAWLLGNIQEAKGYYNPATGRWLSRGPIEEQGFRRVVLRRNLWDTGREPTYAFCKNEPLNSIDVLGLYTEEERQSVCDAYERKHPMSNTDDPDRVRWSWTVICKEGIAYPCIFNKNWKNAFSKEVFACFMAHEESHAEDAPAKKACATCIWHKIAPPELKKEPNCNKYPAINLTFPNEVAIQSECKAYKRLFDCFKIFSRNDPQPLGYLTGIELIEGHLRKNPGKCKEFPDDRFPVEL